MSGETAFRLLVIGLLLLPLATMASPKSAAAGRLQKALRAVIGGAFTFASGATLLLLIVQLLVVLLRSVFSVSFIWLQESTLYLFGAIFLLASAALLLSEGHVRVDLFYAKLTPRQQSVVDLLGLVLFVIPVCALIILVSWDYVATSWAQMERSQEPSGIHAVFLLKTLIPAFAVLLMLAAELRILELVRGRASA
ncbi:MAG: TRAP transporter small permease subunit [Parvularcula sp.]|jgi:TRAP-type mannitol/chloroaromatic compound transport system permease small subunit|nr:TRAP transporter small permease subunit [Parvularcula sp.]